MTELVNNDFNNEDKRKLDHFSFMIEEMVKAGEKTDARLEKLSDLVYKNCQAIEAHNASLSIMKSIVFSIFGVTILLFIKNLVSGFLK